MIANEHIIGILLEKTQSSASDRALRKKLPDYSVEQVQKVHKAVIDCQKSPDIHRNKDDCDKAEPKQPGLDFLCPNRIEMKTQKVKILAKENNELMAENSLTTKIFTTHSGSKSRFLKSFNGTFANSIKQKNEVTSHPL